MVHWYYPGRSEIRIITFSARKKINKQIKQDDYEWIILNK